MQHKRAKPAKEIERTYEISYTVLLTLPYYNAVTFCMIDTMHNLLGSANCGLK